MTSQPRNRRSIGQLDGAHKATALLLAMQKPLADRIIRQFQDSDIRDLARAAVDLPPIGPEALERLVAELAKEIDSASTVEGSTNGASALLAGIVPEDEMSEILGEIAGQPSSKVWKKLASVSEDKVKDFIATEQPQVAAFLLSKLSTEKSAAILAKLDDELRFDISARLVQLKPISDVAIRLLTERLGSELFQVSDASGIRSDNHAMLGAMLNKLDRQQSGAILDRLSAELPKDAQKVRKFVFSFEDVVALTPEDRATLFEQAPTERTVLALRDADPGVASVILDSLSPRVRRLVVSELSNVVKVSPQTIADARRSIGDLALVLAERSIITLPSAEPLAEQRV
ncbi:MAG: FliG C-terminal domain-containing protein [Hyphomicrobiaceae bacterium]|uniref:FliG C-terminal domain-containing protein n=1 Tax=Pseudorhodoplanes sp. TaxID=1934341 RepID=UPI003D0C6154